MAVDMFLKLDGVEGESEDHKHAKEIQIESFSFGVAQTGTSGFGGGSSAGKANWGDLQITKRADASSPVLMLKCATGDHIPNALLTVRKAGKDAQEYYKIKMADLIVSSFNNQGSGHDDIPLESVSLNYTKIHFEYKPQKKDGTLGKVSQAGYDLKANKSA